MSPPRVEAQLASEAWLAEARRLAHVGSWEWDPARDVFVFSEEMCRILGIAPCDGTTGRERFLAQLHPEDVERTRAALLQADERGEAFVQEQRILRADGRVRMLHSRGQFLEGEAGGPRRMVGTSWDITDLWETAAWPERSVSLLRSTLEATADGILVVDRTGSIVTYNRRFLEVWGIPPEVAERSDNATLIALVRDLLVDPETFVRTTAENQANPDQEYFLRLRFKDGRVLERLTRPQRVGTEIVGRVLTFRDVTQREQLLQEAQAAVRLRDEFLAIAAHEIRGPIASMRLAVQGLRAGSLVPDDLPQALDVIDRSQKRLAAFVDKLLDLGRIRSGGFAFDLERVDLAALVQEIAARHEADRAAAGSTLTVQAGAPVVGRWDRLRLDQVVTNLLSNAIKFGDGKPIEVRVTAAGDHALLVVQDQGIGIDRESQRRIFQPFERGVSIRHFGGLGLGLHIVQTIVEGLGGRVAVESEPEAGATFTVELPLDGDRARPGQAG